MSSDKASMLLDQGAIGLGSIAALSLLYLLVLYSVGRLGQRLHGQHPLAPWIFSFALAVYCTSWAFYGVTAQAAVNGWWIPPTYIGSIVLFGVAFQLVSRIAITARRYRITSVADFIATRYGHSRAIAIVTTFIVLLAVIPYIALQLQAISTSIDALVQTSAHSVSPMPQSNARDSNEWYQDTGWYVTLWLAVFALLFAGKSARAHQPNPGLMTAIAFESLVKLIALVSVGLFVCFGLFDGVADVFAQASSSAKVQALQQQAAPTSVYWIHVLLGFLATLCLPRQFHVSFVEIQHLPHLRYARWIFPGYLLLMSIFTLPLALAGTLLLGDNVSIDLVVLQLPLSANRTDVALLAYLGGFSAATSMVIVATVVLGIMLSNDVLMPLLHKFGRADVSVVLLRRSAMLAVLAFGFVYYRGIGSQTGLAQLGLMAFVLIAQLAPSLIFGMQQRRLNRQGALAGLLTGASVWCYLLLLPELQRVGLIDWPWLVHGPFSLQMLAPHWLNQLGPDSISTGTVVSLTMNSLMLWLVSQFSQTRMAEWLDSAAFVGRQSKPSHLPARLTIQDCYSLLRRYSGEHEALELLQRYLREVDPQSPALAPVNMQQGVERHLAAVVGGASMRLLLGAAAANRQLPIESVAMFVDEASQVYQFNQALLSSTLEHINLGVSVVDRDLRLIAWNRHYVEMFHYPPNLIEVGTPVEELIRYNAQRGYLSQETADGMAIEQEVRKRLTYLRQGSSYKFQRRQRDGRVFEMQGNPLPGGGFVTTYTDVSSFIDVQQQLEAANNTLEQRVSQRTAELQQLNNQLATAKQQLEEKSASQHRFFAATSHDLMQPFNAAALFAGLIREQTKEPSIQQLAQQVGTSLSTAEELLVSLLELTKLDAGAVKPQRAIVALHQCLDAVVQDAQVLAQQKGLRLRYRPCTWSVDTDPRLLKRLLQNLLSNAIRYTPRGRLLVGWRKRTRADGQCWLRLEVWDTGVGIAADEQQHIFQEFQQGRRGDQHGLGIGLAISQRISELLDHPLQLWSEEGRGSCFAVSLPLAHRQRDFVAASTLGDHPQQLAGKRILLLDNDPQLRQAVAELLRSWQCEVYAAASPGEALQHVQQHAALDLMLFDYHLDQGATGVQVALQLQQHWGCQAPVIIHSADQQQATREDALNNGYHFMLKPLKAATLKRTLQRLLTH